MNKLWIAGALACVSAFAVAQSAQTQDKAPAQGQTASTRDAASGQTAGKRMHKPMDMSKDDASNKVTPTVQGGKTANDDWHAAAETSNPNTGKGSSPVSVGDVNGDGAADATAKSSGQGSSTGAAPSRDAASGQASGKRQHNPTTVVKQTDASSPNLIQK